MNTKFFILLYFFGFLFILSACKEEKSESDITDLKKAVKATTTVGNSLKQVKSYSQQLKEHEARLKELTPIEKQDLVNWFPEELNGMHRIKMEEERNGFKRSTVVKAFYSNNAPGDNLKRFTIEVMDGAGGQASGVVAGQIAQRQINSSLENASVSQKRVEHNNMSAHQYYSKEYNSTNLNFSYAERYGIVVSSHNLNPEEVWEYVDVLDLEELKNL